MEIPGFYFYFIENPDITTAQLVATDLEVLWDRVNYASSYTVTVTDVSNSANTIVQNISALSGLTQYGYTFVPVELTSFSGKTVIVTVQANVSSGTYGEDGTIGGANPITFVQNMSTSTNSQQINIP